MTKTNPINNCRSLFVFLVLSCLILQLQAAYKPTTYKKLRQIKNLPFATKIGYSFDHRLIILIAQNSSKFYVANGYTYQLIDSFTPNEQDTITSFGFAPDTSFLIVGTNSGYLYVYLIKNHVFDPVPSSVAQNKYNKKINSIDVCSPANIAVGGVSQDLTLYFFQNKTIKLLNTIPFGQAIKCLKFSPNCRKVLLGGASIGKFIAYDYYAQTKNINDYFTYATYHTTSYIAQSTDNEIHIINSYFFVIQQTVKVPIRPNYVLISSAQFYLISGDENSVRVWDISNISAPTIFFTLNQTKLMGINLAGSDILVLSNSQNITYELYSLCGAGEFYDNSYYSFSSNFKNQIGLPEDFKNQCGKCDQVCTICNYYNQCFACAQNAYLNQTSCKICKDTFKGCISCTINDCKSCDKTMNFNPTPINGRCICNDGYYFSDLNICMRCEDVMKGCLTCIDQKTCKVCDDYGHYVVDPITNRCICAAGYYVNAVENCVLCSHKIQFCSLCSKDGLVCNKCQNQTHRIVNPTNKSQCICEDFFYETSQKLCKQCDFIQKCKKCINQNVCEVCNEQNHWIVQKDFTCKCMPGYFQKNNEQCIYCNILGCDKCQEVNSCYLCNQQAGFLPSPKNDPNIHCECKNHTFLDNQRCTLCSQYIKNCDQCDQKTKCKACQPTFVLSQDKSSCKCPQNFTIKDQKCIQNQSNLLQIAVIIALVILIAGVSVVVYVKLCKKKKHLQQNFQTEDKRIREQSQGSKSLLSSLQNDQNPYFDKAISQSQYNKKYKSQKNNNK